MRLDGKPFDQLRSRKVVALLLYLVYQGRPIPREVLADLLWSESTQERAQTNLRVALHDLRRHLQPFIWIGRSEVTIDEEAKVRLDARVLLAELSYDAREIGRLRGALDAYQGEFLAGFFLHGAPAFDDWASTQRENILQRVLDAYRVVVEHDQYRQDYDRGITFARRWLALDPLAEDARRSLMQMLASSGRQAEALLEHQTARRVFDELLGVPLEAATEELAGQIASGQWSPPLVAELLNPVAQLPADQTPFFGRGPELAVLDERLRDSSTRLVTLVGPGGIGKTRLALAAARRQAHESRFTHGVLYLSLADLLVASQIPHVIASGLGLDPPADGDVQDQVGRFLRGRRMLFVLDNLEQVQAAADYLSELLHAAPWLAILATSRERLWLHAEHVVRLQGLPYGREDEQSDIDHAAGQLFVAAAQRSRHDFGVTAENLPAIAHLCRLVEGMPLALELAAGRVYEATVTEILAAITDCYDVLETAIRDIPERHRSIDAVFTSTWEHLEERERELLAAFSVFQGGGDCQAVERVTGARAADLAALVNKSLLRFDPASERYSIHELLRQFAQSKLAADSRKAQHVREAHTGTYLGRMINDNADLRSLAQDEVLNRLETDAANVRRAWNAAVDANQSLLLEGAADTLGFFHLWCNHYQEGYEAFSAAVAAVSTSSPAYPESIARLLTWQGVFAFRRQEKGEAEALYRRSLALLADAPGAASAWAHLRLAQFMLADGRFLESGEHARIARDLAWQLGDAWLEAVALVTLGDTANGSGLYPQALEHYHAARDLFQAQGDRRAEARVLQRMSYAARDLGRMAQGQQYAEQALVLLEAGQDREQLAAGKLALGWLYLYQGVFSQALAIINESVNLHQELGLAAPLTVLGIVHQELGHYDEARRLLSDQITVHRARGDWVDLAFTLTARSVIDVIDGRFEAALPFLQESENLLAESEQRDRHAQVLSVMGHALLGLDRRQEAVGRFRRAIEISLAIDSIIPLLFAVPGVALLLVSNGRIDDALHIYAPLARLPLVANSRLRADLAGKALASAAGMPLEELGRIEGTQKMSLWDAAREALQLL
jgi:predicted ATPase/DNA-binding SARP family transcriptional activator